jgi:hypothetical protein
MEFVSKQTVIKKETFQPMLRLTIDIPKEPLMDLKAIHGQEGLEEIIGKQFVELLKGL